MRVAFAALILSATIHAAPRWVRTLSAIAVCASAGLDAGTTIAGELEGNKESNPLLGGNRGLVRLGILDAASCAGSIWIARHWDKGALWFNGPLAAEKTFVGIHNLKVNGK